MRRLSFALIGLVALSFVPAASAGYTVSDPSFENTQVSGTVYDPTATGSTYTGLAGLINGRGYLGNPSPVSGTQVAFIEYIPGSTNANNAAGVITETVTFDTAGIYTLSVFDATRPGYSPSAFRASLTSAGGTVIGAGGETPTTTSFTQYVSPTFTVAVGTYTLTFTASATSSDTTTFLDNITFNNTSAVPEPTSFALMGLGLVIAGGVARARRNRTV